METIFDHRDMRELNLYALQVGSGVYCLIKRGQIVYVGQAHNIAERIIAHIREGVKDFDRVTYQLIPPAALNDVESLLIKTIRPPLNMKCTEPHNGQEQRSSRSVISITHCVFHHQKKKDETMNVKIRVTFHRRSVYYKTNFWVYEEDVQKGRIVNPKILNDLRPILDKYRNAIKYIASDKSIEFVRNKLRNIA